VATVSPFETALMAVIDAHRATVNAPTRAQTLLVTALAIVDSFKLENTTRGEALTEDEWLKLSREVYWRARTALQGEAS
jgi:hypothetical protein